MVASPFDARHRLLNIFLLTNHPQSDYCTLENGALVGLRWMDPHTFFLPSSRTEKLTPQHFTQEGNVW